MLIFLNNEIYAFEETITSGWTPSILIRLLSADVYCSYIHMYIGCFLLFQQKCRKKNLKSSEKIEAHSVFIFAPLFSL